MRNKLTLAIASLLTVFMYLSFAVAQATDSLDTSPDDLGPNSGNHFHVMHAMRTIHSAQLTYAQTYGVGNFGSLQSLSHAGLIDAALGAGEKHGYRFSSTIRLATPQLPAIYDLNAVPSVRRARAFSYYQNEGCDIYGADKFGRNATVVDPIVDPCGISVRSENERAVMASMRLLQSAQITYQATIGAGQFGTIQQLYDAGLYTTGFGLAFIWKGYRSHLLVFPANGTTPTRFAFRATPTVYGRTGMRSFYIDESGLLRGTDNGGSQGSASDAVIDDCADGSIIGNERCTVQNLRLLHSAQMTYAATIGNGHYGRFEQLFAAGLINATLASHFARGYVYSESWMAPTQTFPATFQVYASPTSYGGTGIRSFHIDQTGILRGADKNGAPAGPSDPPINN